MTRRLLPAALAALLVLGACGSQSDEVSVVTITPLDSSAAGADNGATEDTAASVPATEDSSVSESTAASSTAPGSGSQDTDELIPAGGGPGESRLVKAAQLAAEAQVSFRFEAHIRMNGLPQVGTIDMPMQGEFDHQHNRMGMAMDLSSMLSQIADDGAQSMPGTMRMVVDGDVAYMSMGELGTVFGAAPDGWIRIDTASGGGTGSMMSGTSDPRAFLALLAGDDGSVAEVGREDVRGVPTTHYQGTLDMAAAMASASQTQQQELSEALSAQGLSLDALGALEMPVEVWIGDDGLARRVVITMDLGSMAGAMGGAGTGEVAGVTMEINMEMFDYGASIDVPLPPPDKVVDLQG